MPVTVSCHIQVDIIVVMAVPAKKPCAMVSSGGTLMIVHGELPPLKDLAISAKPGGGIHIGVKGLSGSVFAHWLEMVKVPDIWLETVKVFAIAGMVSFEHPILWVMEKNPKCGLSYTYCGFIPT